MIEIIQYIMPNVTVGILVAIWIYGFVGIVKKIFGGK